MASDSGFCSWKDKQLGMTVWKHASCTAHVAEGGPERSCSGLGGQWASVYMIESGERGKGHAQALLCHMQQAYEARRVQFGASIPLNPIAHHLFVKLGIVHPCDTCVAHLRMPCSIGDEAFDDEAFEAGAKATTEAGATKAEATTAEATLRAWYGKECGGVKSHTEMQQILEAMAAVDPAKVDMELLQFGVDASYAACRRPTLHPEEDTGIDAPTATALSAQWHAVLLKRDPDEISNIPFWGINQSAVETGLCENLAAEAQRDVAGAAAIIERVLLRDHVALAIWVERNGGTGKPL